MNTLRPTKRFQSLAVKLVGDRSTVALEHRILNAIMFLVFLTGILITIQNILFGNSVYMIVATMLCAAAGFAGHRLSLKLQSWQLLLIPVFAFFLMLLSFCWLTQAGTNGTIGYYFFLLIAFAVVLFKGKTGKIVSLAVTTTIVVSLLLVEFFFPEIILPYQTPLQRFADVAFSLIFCLGMSAVFMYIVYNEYREERRNNDSLLAQIVQEKESVERSMREKQRLLSVVCHDIANALTIVKGDVSLLKMSKSPAVSVDRPTIDRMRYACSNIEEIISSVRLMEAIEQERVALSLEAVDLQDVFRNAEIIFTEQLASRRLRLELPPLPDRVRYVLAEPKILANQVFNNLISNAIKFSYSDSTITVNVERRNSETAISVTDQGIGIPPELAARLFDFKEKTSRPGVNGEPGTGFGMRTVKSFVDLFGGSISVVSQPQTGDAIEHGTTVTITLKSANAPDS